jgi:hypothetical protein
MFDLDKLIQIKASYRRFIQSCNADDAGFKLTPLSDPSPYALCFAIFGLRLLKCDHEIEANRDRWNALLRANLEKFRKNHVGAIALRDHKPYMQLLTFTLSALSILRALESDPLKEEVSEVLPSDVKSSLTANGAIHGKPQSGNHAMFIGILLLHAQDHLGQNTQHLIDHWVHLHMQSMNRYGFWGTAQSMSHLQFQNGYHQYELLEYLHVAGVHWDRAADAVAELADSEGHFAPYPGGGGCYDYDAVFLLTAGGDEVVKRHADLLLRTARTIVSEQNLDGGFCESVRIRPRSLDNLSRTIRHVMSANGVARVERLRYGLTLLRPKHDRIHTHWSQYSRRWDESDLWDSWFRMLTLARIEVALAPDKASEWGFIDYPGIGFHPSVRLERMT